MASPEAIPRDSTRASQRIEIITGHERRRQYSDADKVRLIAEAQRLASALVVEIPVE